MKCKRLRAPFVRLLSFGENECGVLAFNQKWFGLFYWKCKRLRAD